MRSKLLVATAGLILAAALGVPAGAQASASVSRSAHATATPATTAGLVNRGCGFIWDPGSDPDGSPTTGEYALVSGNALDYALIFQPLSDAYPGTFCNVSVTNVNGAFEISDESNCNSAGECACLAVNTSVGAVVDDTISACNNQDYKWDQWYAVNSGQTYHGQTLWEFKNRYDNEYLTNDGGYAIYAGLDFGVYQEFSWNGSNL
jgi:hypothetical protein